MDKLPTKKEMLDNFRNNETAKTVLSLIENEKEKRIISAIAENFVNELYDTFFKINEKLVENSTGNSTDTFEKLVEQFKTNVITVDSNKNVEKTNVEDNSKQ